MYSENQSRTLELEEGTAGAGFQILRSVVDTINKCNKACRYCHPHLSEWRAEYLPSQALRSLFREAEARGFLEITLTGGEILLHPEFTDILHDSHLLRRTIVTLITNGTLLTPRVVDALHDANVSRVCISLDGPDSATHNSAREGDDFSVVMHTLQMLKHIGVEVTIISVAHQLNYRALPALSDLL